MHGRGDRHITQDRVLSATPVAGDSAWRRHASILPPPDRLKLRSSLGLSEHFTIGCFGRIRHDKGTDVFVDAMLEVLPHHPNASALVMGRATAKYRPFLKLLREKVVLAGLEDRILFLPEAPLDACRAGTRRSTCSSPLRIGGFGLTTFEAMACGVPVIATTVGSFGQVVVEDRDRPPGSPRRH